MVNNQLNLGAKIVDLRSDTISRPTQLMRQAMFEASVGDDVYGEDPTVNELERKAASLLGKEAGLFLPSGTMGNLISIMVHCTRRGSEVILGDLTHTVLYEQGGAAQIAGVSLCTLPNHPDGTFDIEVMKSKVRTRDIHEPTSSLIIVENTHNICGGKVIPLKWLDELAEVAASLKIPLHMDGARLFNAAVYLGVPASTIVKNFSSVTFCLSKSLGAPVGSVLVGSKTFIYEARRARKALGGGMRQSGFLAAAGIVALDTMIDRLSVDHKHTYQIAKAIQDANSKYIKVDLENLHTNILFVWYDATRINSVEFCERLEKVHEDEKKVLGKEVAVKMVPLRKNYMRLVLYHEITDEDVQDAIDKLLYVMKKYE
ncbi:probable low-specificity L-threonine aldolase 2 isoform X2 [Ischnura elegans]|uniref:probable low-specificity L-threonine aldolase 2 isoform X2 n=1 Tax=Ischnura elegans TaxID=197161 RepID=UPI001ED8A9FA|nr:probable low-specificity L-threonine aldolase 2 isoform X2 [Ischnura elegans]